MNPLDLRREQRAARRRSLQVLVQRRLERVWAPACSGRRQAGAAGSPAARSPLANASISSTGRMPTDS